MEHEQWQWQEPGRPWKGVGIYHVTLTIPSRMPLLGKLIIPGNNPDKAEIIRTELGEALVRMLLNHPKFYPEVRILQFCLMPDHLHAIIYVTRPSETSIRLIVRSLWQGAKKIGREYSFSIGSESNSEVIYMAKQPALDAGTTEKETAVEESRPALDAGTMEKETNTAYPCPIFTKQPFIRPLSRYEQLQTMYSYIRMNPQRLATKRLKPEYFYVQSDIVIAGRKYSGVGNATLLQAAQYAPVHVRRTMVQAAEQGYDQVLRDYMNGCVLKARKGVIMVSPFISPKEREIMEVLLREKHAFIYIADNGFHHYYKPADSLFDSVAEGRVMILSPWEYDEKKQQITREECVAMNQMAEEICGELSA